MALCGGVTVRGHLRCRTVEGNRRYADEPEPSWYSGQGQYTTPRQSPYDSGVHERPSGAFRLPEQRRERVRDAVAVRHARPGDLHGQSRPPRRRGRRRSQDQRPRSRSADPSTRRSARPGPRRWPTPRRPATYGGGSSAPVSSAPARSAERSPPTTSRPASCRRSAASPPEPESARRLPHAAPGLGGRGRDRHVVLMVPAVLLLVQATFVGRPDRAAASCRPSCSPWACRSPARAVRRSAGGGRPGRDAWLRAAGGLPAGGPRCSCCAAGLAVSAVRRPGGARPEAPKAYA